MGWYDAAEYSSAQLSSWRHNEALVNRRLWLLLAPYLGTRNTLLQSCVLRRAGCVCLTRKRSRECLAQIWQGVGCITERLGLLIARVAKENRKGGGLSLAYGNIIDERSLSDLSCTARYYSQERAASRSKKLADVTTDDSSGTPCII